MFKTNNLNFNQELLLVWVIALILCFSNIWGYPIAILDEAKNAEAAREMWLNNSWIPTFNGDLRTDKPPLHYFFMQLSYSVFGDNALGARFFSALFGSLFFVIFYLFLRRNATLFVARSATLILLSSFFWIQEFHLAVPDPYLLFFLVGAWMSFYEFFERKKILFLFIFYAFVGLATLAKGPIAIALTGLIVLVFLIYQKEISFKKIIQYRPILGGILTLLIATPWFYWIHNQTEGAFTQGFFIQHNVERFGSAMEGHSGIFLLTWLYVILGLFPFGAFIPQAIWNGWKFLRKNSLIAFCWFVAVVVIIIFSVSGTKLPNYTLPAIPFLAILTAFYFEKISTLEIKSKWTDWVSINFILLISCLLPIAYYVIGPYNLSHLPTILVIGLMILIVLWFGIKTIRNFKFHNVAKWINSITVMWIFLGLIIFYGVFPLLAKESSIIKVEEKLKNKNVVVLESYDPAFNFNLKRNFEILKSEADLNKKANLNPDLLVLTKNRVIQRSPEILNNWSVILEEATLFEGYKTVILKRKNGDK